MLHVLLSALASLGTGWSGGAGGEDECVGWNAIDMSASGGLIHLKMGQAGSQEMVGSCQLVLLTVRLWYF